MAFRINNNNIIWLQFRNYCYNIKSYNNHNKCNVYNNLKGIRSFSAIRKPHNISKNNNSNNINNGNNNTNNNSPHLEISPRNPTTFNSARNPYASIHESYTVENKTQESISNLLYNVPSN